MAITILSTILYRIRISLTEYIGTRNCVVKTKILQMSHIYQKVVCKIPLLARRTRPKGSAGRPSAARDDRVSCIQIKRLYTRYPIVARL